MYVGKAYMEKGLSNGKLRAYDFIPKEIPEDEESTIRLKLEDVLEDNPESLSNHFVDIFLGSFDEMILLI